MKKLILLTLLSSAYARIEYPADSLLKSKNTTFFQKIFIYPVAQWQKISYKSSALNCQFYPSCSNYCSLAIKENGPLFGSIIAMDRITRCNPSALSYHQKINGSYKDEDGRLIKDRQYEMGRFRGYYNEEEELVEVQGGYPSWSGYYDEIEEVLVALPPVTEIERKVIDNINKLDGINP